VKKFNTLAFKRFRSYLLLALLTSFVIGVAYFVHVKPFNTDAPSNSIIPEVADYERDVEDNIDDDPLFIASSLLNQSLDLDWGNTLHTSIITPSFAKISYRARPRSPPF
jgi:hypothetical protein